MKLSSKDKSFITAELKRLDRREYNQRGKTDKYKKLSSQFTAKYRIEAEKFVNKNMDALRESKLPNHESESLSDEECSEHITQHFSSISQEFPPLDVNCLPERVQSKL